MPRSVAAALLCLAPACIFLEGPVFKTVSVDSVFDSAFDSADDPGEGSCEEERYDIGFGEPTDLGFSAADAVALLAGPREAELTYAAGGVTTIQVGVAHDGGAVQYIHRESGDPSVTCTDTVVLGVTATYSTADGLFAETAASTLHLSELAGGVSFHPRVRAADLAGSFSRTYTDYVEFVTFVSGDAFTGEIVAVDEANGEEDSDDECGVGAWGAPLMTGCD